MKPLKDWNVKIGDRIIIRVDMDGFMYNPSGLISANDYSFEADVIGIHPTDGICIGWKESENHPLDAQHKHPDATLSKLKQQYPQAEYHHPNWDDYAYANLISSDHPVLGFVNRVVVKIKAGCVCKQCNASNEYASPNRADGSYVCFECRR